MIIEVKIYLNSTNDFSTETYSYYINSNYVNVGDYIYINNEKNNFSNIKLAKVIKCVYETNKNCSEAYFLGFADKSVKEFFDNKFIKNSKIDDILCKVKDYLEKQDLNKIDNIMEIINYE